VRGKERQREREEGVIEGGRERAGRDRERGGRDRARGETER